MYWVLGSVQQFVDYIIVRTKKHMPPRPPYLFGLTLLLFSNWTTARNVRGKKRQRQTLLCGFFLY